MRFTRVVSRIALFALVVAVGGTAAAQTTGTIVGTIQDASNGNPVSGALVIAQSPSLQGEQTALTGDEGTFRISLLPPGIYTILVQADGFRPAERPGIRVDLDKTIRVTQQMVPEALRAEDVVVTTEAPVIDQGSTTQGAVIPENFSQNVPTGRSFQSVLNVAPGATSDGLGTTFRGSSSPENSWIVDGVNTTDLINGDGSTSLPTDFIKQVEVKTGGYQAEYGRASGGVVNVVTKSGGNEFSGDVFVNFSSGALALEKKDVGAVTSVISSESRNDLDVDFGFDLGGYIIKDKLWFFVGVTPFANTTRYTRRVQPFILDAAGESVLDADGNPTFGPVLESLTEPFYSNSLSINRIAKLTYNVSEDHSAQLSYYGNPTDSDGILYTSLNGTEEANSSTETSGAEDLAVRWTSKLFDKSMLLEAWYGMHQQDDTRQPLSEFTGGDQPGFADNAVRFDYPYLPPEFDGVSGCEPVVPGDPTTSPCASEQYADGPLWFTENNYSIRHSANLKLTNFVDFFGEHAIKWGGDVEFNRFLNRRGYINDWAYRVYPDGLPFKSRRQGLGTVDADGNFTVTDNLVADTNTRNTALFVQDSYQPFDGLNVNLGLRWETQSMYGEGSTEPAITIGDNFAPRLGATYDWTGSGRSKVELYYGRFFESVPLNINARAFSEEVFGLQWIDEAGNNINRFGMETYTLGGGTVYTVPGLQGQFVDEFSGGVQYEILPDLAVGVTLVHREIGRVIEDVSPDDGHTYIIANPGDEGSVRRSLDIIEEDIRGFGGTITDGAPDCSGATDAEACALAEENWALTDGVRHFPKPERTYDAIELMVRKNFSRNWYMVGSLTFSKTLGNYPGLFAPENGQLDANITSQYDLISLLPNRSGPLRTDRPVYFKVDGYYLWDFGLITGASLRAYSGRPIDALAGHPLYGPGEAFLLPRGVGGRLDPLFGVDVNLGYDLKVTEDVKVNFNVNVFNLFNFQETANVDHEYTLSEVNPVVGGTLEDIEVRDAAGNHVPTILDVYGDPVVYNRNWGSPVSPVQIQDPLTVRLGMRVSF